MYVIMIRTGRGWRPMNGRWSGEPRTFATYSDAFNTMHTIYADTIGWRTENGGRLVYVKRLPFQN